MDVALTEDQELLREAARELLGAECPMPVVRAGVDPPEATVAERDSADGPGWSVLWRRLAELGWLGLALPEQYGGAGLSFVDQALLLEETGRALVPAPFLSCAVLGARAIELAGDASQKADLLPRIARGELRATLAQRDAGGDWHPDTVSLAADDEGDGWVLSGRKPFVWDADTADVIVVAARAADGPTLFLVPRDALGVAVRRVEFIDRTRAVCDVSLDAVRLPRRAALGAPGGALPVLSRLGDVARAALAVEACGGAQWALDATVAYARSREQFGAPIGSFQAVSHRCADMFVKVESARSAAYYAAWVVDCDASDAHASACMAKAYCADAFAKVAGDAIQVHGGLGFTWEQHVHLYYKRAVATQLAFGDAVFTRELAARELIDGAPAAGGGASAGERRSAPHA